MSKRKKVWGMVKPGSVASREYEILFAKWEKVQEDDWTPSSPMRKRITPPKLKVPSEPR